ncbi:unnamed protein product [Effrenium voratum]|nr:unnamed protein product [Effrenium voratum]
MCDGAVHRGRPPGAAEAAWLRAWLGEDDLPGRSEAEVPVAEALTLALPQLLAADLAPLVAASGGARAAVRAATWQMCRARGLRPLPLPSLQWFQTARLYENFDSSALAGPSGWQRWGDLAEDEERRVMGGGAFRVQLTRPHPDAVFGRGARLDFGASWHPKVVSVRLRIEAPASRSFSGGQVGYVILGDTTPAWECGSRFGHEAIFLFASAGPEGFDLEWCVGSASALVVSMNKEQYGSWVRCGMALNWPDRELRVWVNGHFLGRVPFRDSACEKAEHLTLVNSGGPARASWSEVVVV